MSRVGVSFATGLLVLGCVLQIARNPKPLLVWNVTASAPIGLYRRSSAPMSRGSWVLVRPPTQVAVLAATRRYLPLNVPMIKRIAGLAGDKVCRVGELVSVNDTVRATALMRDKQGRLLPTWHGCQALRTDQILLLNVAPSSFDSRYFGPVSRGNIIERIEPLWTF